MSFPIFQIIDSHTSISYQVSAPGGGGLVDSRDFVNLRCWQVIKNGNIIEDIETVNEDRTVSRDSLQKSEQNIHEIKRATSEINLSDNQIPGQLLDKSVLSLSKSLGAKVFSDEESEFINPEMFSSRSTTDDADEFVDANETQGAQSTNDSSHRSEEAEHIKDIASDLCDKMYIVSGVSIKYDQMPNIAKYTRYVSFLFRSNSVCLFFNWDTNFEFPKCFSFTEAKIYWLAGRCVNQNPIQIPAHSNGSCVWI